MEASKARDSLKQIFQAGIDAVNGKNSVKRFLNNRPITSPIYLIAIGKAAASMAEGAIEMCSHQIQDGLVITKKEHSTDLPFPCIESSHPIPDESSIEAGACLLDFIQRTPSNAYLLFLISGGTSSLVEVLPAGFSLHDLKELNQKLLASHLSISEINKIRAQHSLIKGGGLVRYLGDRQVLQLLISDVPSDRPEEIGSGLLFSQNGVDQKQIESYVVASIYDAMKTSANFARNLGFDVDLDQTPVTGQTEVIGKALAHELLDGLPRMMIRGGETSMTLPENPGQGGRNQHLALSAATVLAGHQNVYFLAAGTDGTDGPGDSAGAIVDGETLERGRLQGLDALNTLKNADSGSFLKITGDRLKTGPTHTNVMDLMISLKTHD